MKYYYFKDVRDGKERFVINTVFDDGYVDVAVYENLSIARNFITNLILADATIIYLVDLDVSLDTKTT